MELHLDRAPEGLTKRARYFVVAHGIRLDVPPVSRHREQWLALGIPPVEIDRATAYQERWGGLVLPPAPHYDGGPRYLDTDVPERPSAEGWWDDVDALELDAFEPVKEVKGLGPGHEGRSVGPV
ncbi:hypothetical protein [Streptomyces prunicolor]